MIVHLRELMESSKKRVAGGREGRDEERAWQRFHGGMKEWSGAVWET